MNLVIDYGNTRAKVGLFQHNRLVEQFIFDDLDLLKKFLQSKVVNYLLICSVNESAQTLLEWAEVKKEKWALSAKLPLPISIEYQTPDTLGADRIAAVCGALEIFPDRPCLVIDAGTCITYEFLDSDRKYYGGAISPGVRMRFQAMHTLTARLPLVEIKKDPPLIGRNTKESMQSGVINGMLAEIKGMITQYQERHPQLGVILCGGDYYLFENQLKPSIFVAPELVLTGLNRILTYNAGLH